LILRKADDFGNKEPFNVGSISVQMRLVEALGKCRT